MAKRGVDCTMTLPRALVTRLDRLANLQGTSRSEVARELLGAALSEGEDLVKVLADDRVRKALMGAMMKPGVMKSMAQALGEELSPADGQKLFQFFRAAGAITGKGNV
jgi:predicted DNA-binding protein